jgi:hypothetical protein
MESERYTPERVAAMLALVRSWYPVEWNSRELGERWAKEKGTTVRYAMNIVSVLRWWALQRGEARKVRRGVYAWTKH